MAEYVNRQEVIDALQAPEILNINPRHIELIKNIPAADVAPVVHGRWISLAECENEGVYCSICKKKVWKSEYAWYRKKRRNKL